MPIKNPFIQRVLKSFDRIDKESLQNYLLDLAEENRLYRETFHQLNEGIILIERNGKIRYVNYQASVWLGFESVASGKPQTLQQISDSELKRFLREQIGKVKERVVSDVHVLSPDELDLGVILVPIVGTREDYVLVIMINRSGEKAPLIDQERMARIEALISLAAGIAHEIGNPLNSLSIHLQICQKEIKGLSKAQKKVIENSLNVMSAETERLDRIVRNFLKATRRHPLRYRLENINQILEEAINILMPELKNKKIKVDFKPDASSPLFLQDRDRLNLAFINLIKNGMESMPRGGRLRIEISHQGKIVEIKFQDEGKGIDEEELPHIFEAYYTTKEEGSGLGLMTVYNAISEHGGRIEVASKVGKGTTFTVLLPMRLPKLQLPKYDLSAKKA